MKKFSCFLATCIAVIIGTTTLFGCTSTKGDSLNLTGFGTAFHLEVYDKPLSQDLKSQIKNLITDTDEKLSAVNSSSEIYDFNRVTLNTPYAFSPLAYGLIKRSIEYYNETDGRFNPLVYPLTRLWGFTPDLYPLKDFTLPNSDDINQALNLANVQNLTLSDGDLTITKSLDGTQIDLGGMAKGYIVNEVRNLLTENGHQSGYISFGGSSLYILKLFSDQNVLGIRHPVQNDRSVIELKSNKVTGKAVSTSGDYEKFYEVDSVRYSHLINPLNGYPINGGVTSCTLLGGDAERLDALSTAICTLSYDPDIHSESELILFLQGFASQNLGVDVFVTYNAKGERGIITNLKSGIDFNLLDSTYLVKSINS